jgi:hypothetical protein
MAAGAIGQPFGDLCAKQTQSLSPRFGLRSRTRLRLATGCASSGQWQSLASTRAFASVALPSLARRMASHFASNIVRFSPLKQLNAAPRFHAHTPGELNFLQDSLLTKPTVS